MIDNLAERSDSKLNMQGRILRSTAPRYSTNTGDFRIYNSRKLLQYIVMRERKNSKFQIGKDRFIPQLIRSAGTGLM